MDLIISYRIKSLLTRVTKLSRLRVILCDLISYLKNVHIL